MSKSRFLPLSPELKPLIAWKSKPELGMSNGLEYGPWIAQGVEQGYGVGILLEQSGLVVVDCDSGIELGRETKEVFGWEVFKSLCADLGHDVPKTFTVETKTAGHFHFYFRQNPAHRIVRTAIRTLVDHVDIKATGYVVSWHTAGYTIRRKMQPVMFPDWLAEPLATRQSDRDVVHEAGDRNMTDDHYEYILQELAQSTEGGRNARLHATAKAFLYADRTRQQDRNALLQAASLAGLTDNEAARTVDSSWGTRN